MGKMNQAGNDAGACILVRVTWSGGISVRFFTSENFPLYGNS